MYETIKRLYTKTKNPAVVESLYQRLDHSRREGSYSGRGGVNESN